MSPYPLVPGGGYSLLRERGWGVPVQTRGDTVVLKVYVMWDIEVSFFCQKIAPFGEIDK